MSDKNLNMKCDIHSDQIVYVHLTKYYCPRCKRWEEIKEI